nr:VOC family protein [uncultured Psychroserpens sp.]
MYNLKNHAIFFCAFIAFFCTSNSFSQELSIDHVIILVPDLDKSIEKYKDHGFTLKKGRKHENGIVNSHIKFKNKSSIELISVSDKPKDDISKDYYNLKKNKEQGVFLAISGFKIREIEKKIESLDIKYEIINTKYWNYLTFKSELGLNHIFFIEYKFEVQDSLNLFTHKNHSEKIKSINIDGNDLTITLLKHLGLKYSVVNDKENKHSFLTKNGTIVVENNSITIRPYIKKIVFKNLKNEKTYEMNF